MNTKTFFITVFVLLLLSQNSITTAQNNQTKNREQELVEALPEGFELKEYSLEDLARHKWRSQLAHLPNMDWQQTYSKDGLMTLYINQPEKNYKKIYPMYFYLSNTLDTVFDKSKMTNTKGKYIITLLEDKLLINDIILELTDSTLISFSFRWLKRMREDPFSGAHHFKAIIENK